MTAIALRRAPVHRDERFCVVALHAHPDDESLLTGGTLARAAAEGHRIVVVVATAGGAGLTGAPVRDLGAHRLIELRRAAAALGVTRIECLGYADSGLRGESTDPCRFAVASPASAAERLAAIVEREHADILTGYDAAGGYGHPDHVQVHRVARLAAAMTGSVLLEATVDRREVLRAARAARVIPHLPPPFRPPALRGAFTAHDELTHCVDVRAFLDRKRAAFAAHATQRTGGDRARALAIYLRLPDAVFATLFGREWFREVGRRPGAELVDDIFATLRTPSQ